MKQRDIGTYAAAFLIPVGILLGVYMALGIFPFGGKSLLTVDMNNQYIHMLIYCKEMLRGGASWRYTFSTALGSGMQGISAYYLISPFNLLLLLFPNRHMASGILLITLLKTGMGGLTFAVMDTGLRSRRSPARTLIFSCSFALMAYSIVYQQNIMWLDSVMALPLVVLGLHRIVRGRRPFLYMFSLFFCLVCNYYIGYMICIFSVLYFLYLLAGESGRGRAVPVFAAASALGGGMAMFLLIPTFRSLSGGKMGFDPGNLLRQITVPRFHWSDFFIRLFPGSFSYTDLIDGLPNVFCGCLTLFLVLCFFLGSRIALRKKIAAAAVLLCLYAASLSHGLYMFWHGFNDSNWFPDRHSFVFSFFMLILAAEGLEALTGEGRRRARGVLLLAAGVMGALCLWMAGKHYPFMNRWRYLLFAGVTAGAALLLTLRGKSARLMRFAAPGLLLLALADLGANTYLTLGEMNYKPYSEFSDYYSATQSGVAYVKERDAGLYRMEKTFHKKECEPMTFCYRGLSHYSSAQPMSSLLFLSRMGFTYANTWAVYNSGSTYAADALLGVKYVVSKDALEEPYDLLEQVGDNLVYENRYALPLGFAVSDQALTFNDDEDDRVLFQNALWRSLCPGEGEDILKEVPARAAFRNLAEDGDEAGCYVRENPDKKAWVKLTLTAPSSDPLFAFLYTDEQHPVDLSVNGKKLGRYFNVYRHGVIRLGSFAEGEEVTLRISLREDKLNLKRWQIFSQDMAAFAACYDQMAADPFESMTKRDDRIMGTVSATQEKPYILFTIPMEEGWTAYVDGRKEQISQAAGIFMAVPASPGIHDILLTYTPPGFYPGLALSAVSLLLCVLWMISGRKRENHFTLDRD